MAVFFKKCVRIRLPDATTGFLWWSYPYKLSKMKTLYKALSLSGLLLLVLAPGVHSQNKETRTVPSFSGIDLAGSPNLYLTQGSPQSVVLEGTPEDLAKIKTEVHDNTLEVGQKNDQGWDWKSMGRVNVYVTVPEINALTVSGSGSIEVENKIKTGDFEVRVSGSGSLQCDMDAGNLDATVSGSGSAKLGGTCKAFRADVGGSGDIKGDDLSISGDADLHVAGSGGIRAAGTASTVHAEISGSGRIMTGDLQAEKCYVRITGSGDVQINVTKELQADITGSGSVSYRGNPSIVNSNSAGSGKVRHM